MMKIPRVPTTWLWVALFAFFTGPALSWAGSISLQVQADAQPTRSGWTVSVQVVNRGDDTAHNLRASLRMTDADVQSQTSDKLFRPGASEVFRFKMNGKPKKYGQYPLFIAIDYTDANRYPFTALAFLTVDYRTAHSPAISAVLEGVELAEDETLHLRVKNLGAETIAAQALLFLPKELSSAEAAQTLNLKPAAEISVPFPLHRFSALPGSTYPVYAVIQYESDKEHYCVPASATIKIIEKKRSILQPWFLAALVLILAASWAIRAYRSSP